MDSLSVPGAEIKFKESAEVVMADFDGNFVLPVESEIENYSLVISYSGLSIVIKNLELNEGKLNIGDFEIPYFEDISIKEFEILSELEKENCLPIYHWTQLLGYFNTKKLDTEYLTLNCQKKITEFEYNPKTKTVLVDWNLIKHCE